MKLQLCYYDILKSTNITAVETAQNGADEGTVIIAKRQNGGHGRMNRVWSSPEGGLWFSIILRPNINPEKVAQLTLLTGVAVAQTLRDLYETDKVKIKWPNDLLLDGKKICGILSEMQLKENGEVDYAVIGVGVNVNLCQDDFSEELREIATSLKIATHKEFSCESVLQEIMNNFITLYDTWLREGSYQLMTLWKDLNCTLGKKVLVKDDDRVIFEGIATEIDEKGAIVVYNESGEKKVYDFGEISIR